MESGRDWLYEEPPAGFAEIRAVIDSQHRGGGLWRSVETGGERTSTERYLPDGRALRIRPSRRR